MLSYHPGQRELQDEANTRAVADMLAGWSGPVSEFCRTADMIVIATEDRDRRLSFTVVSGSAPLIQPVGANQLILRGASLDASSVEQRPFGALAINLGAARRARLNGMVGETPDGLLLTASEAFTNCRKYIAPSEALDGRQHLGPVSREPVDPTDAELGALLMRAETSFLATMAPDATIDVSHRGGPPGFLRLDAKNRALQWDEYVGDGMFKSAGNIRATGRVSLLILDLPTGNGAEIEGKAEVTVERRDQIPRLDALLQHREQYPIQGSVRCQLEAVRLAAEITSPRRRLQKRQRVTSASALEQQYPQ